MPTDAEILANIQQQLAQQREREHDARKAAVRTNNIQTVLALVNTGLNIYATVSGTKTQADVKKLQEEAAKAAAALAPGAITPREPFSFAIEETRATNIPSTTTVAERAEQGGVPAEAPKKGGGAIILLGIGLKLLGVF